MRHDGLVPRLDGDQRRPAGGLYGIRRTVVSRMRHSAHLRPDEFMAGQVVGAYRIVLSPLTAE